MARIAALTLENLFADGSGTAEDLANFKLAAQAYRDFHLHHGRPCTEDEAIDAIYRGDSEGDFWAQIEAWATIPGTGPDDARAQWAAEDAEKLP